MSVLLAGMFSRQRDTPSSQVQNVSALLQEMEDLIASKSRHAEDTETNLYIKKLTVLLRNISNAANQAKVLDGNILVRFRELCVQLREKHPKESRSLVMPQQVCCDCIRRKVVECVFPDIHSADSSDVIYIEQQASALNLKHVLKCDTAMQELLAESEEQSEQAFAKAQNAQIVKGSGGSTGKGAFEYFLYEDKSESPAPYTSGSTDQSEEPQWELVGVGYRSRFDSTDYSAHFESESGKLRSGSQDEYAPTEDGSSSVADAEQIVSETTGFGSAAEADADSDVESYSLQNSLIPSGPRAGNPQVMDTESLCGALHWFMTQMPFDVAELWLPTIQSLPSGGVDGGRSGGRSGRRLVLKPVSFVTSSKDCTRLNNFIDASKMLTFELGQGVPGSVSLMGTPHVVTIDTDAYTNSPRLKAAHDAGISFGVSLPLRCTSRIMTLRADAASGMEPYHEHSVGIREGESGDGENNRTHNDTSETVRPVISFITKTKFDPTPEMIAYLETLVSRWVLDINVVQRQIPKSSDDISSTASPNNTV